MLGESVETLLEVSKRFQMGRSTPFPAVFRKKGVKMAKIGGFTVFEYFTLFWWFLSNFMDNFIVFAVLNVVSDNSCTFIWKVETSQMVPFILRMHVRPLNASVFRKCCMYPVKMVQIEQNLQKRPQPLIFAIFWPLFFWKTAGNGVLGPIWTYFDTPKSVFTLSQSI